MTRFGFFSIALLLIFISSGAQAGKGKVVSVDDPIIAAGIKRGALKPLPAGFEYWSGYIYWVKRSETITVKDPDTGLPMDSVFILKAVLMRVEDQETDTTTYPIEVGRKADFKRKFFRRRHARKILFTS